MKIMLIITPGTSKDPPKSTPWEARMQGTPNEYRVFRCIIILIFCTSMYMFRRHIALAKYNTKMKVVFVFGMRGCGQKRVRPPFCAQYNIVYTVV